MEYSAQKAFLRSDGLPFSRFGRTGEGLEAYDLAAAELCPTENRAHTTRGH